VDFLNMRQARPVADSSQGTDLLMDVQTQIEVLQTAVLTENTKKAMTQIGPKRDWQPYPAAWRTLAHNDSGPVAPMDKILDSVADSINVRPVGQTRVIRIEVDAPSPILAADFANTLVREYIQQNIKSRSQ